MDKSFLFIDCDNISHLNAEILIHNIKAVSGPVLYVFLAGNNAGGCVDQWSNAITPLISSLSVVEKSITPLEPESADVEIIIKMDRISAAIRPESASFIVATRDNQILAACNLLHRSTARKIFIASALVPSKPFLPWINLSKKSRAKTFEQRWITLHAANDNAPIKSLEQRIKKSSLVRAMSDMAMIALKNSTKGSNTPFIKISRSDFGIKLLAAGVTAPRDREVIRNELIRLKIVSLDCPNSMTIYL